VWRVSVAICLSSVLDEAGEKSMNVKRFRQRATLGARYVKEYLMDEVSEAYGRHYLPPKPLDVICEISYVCNLACPTCFRWTAKPDEHELSSEQWKSVLAKLKAWLGTFNLTFTGGEPFLRKDILDIFKFASANGIITGVVSNGSLIDKALAKDIVASGLDGLALSLNSLKRHIHNQTRGTNGSFDEVMTAIENLRERKGMRLSLSTTVVRENIGELIDMVEFVKSNGLYGIHFQPIMPASTLPTFDKEGQFKKVTVGTPYRNLLKRKEVIDDKQIDEVFDRLITMTQRGYPIISSAGQLKEMAKYLKDPTNPEILEKVCQVGVKNFNIDPFGNVRLCSIMEVVGNITKDSPSEIWRSVNSSNQRENIRACEKTCRLMFCNHKELDFKQRFKRVVGSLTD
jgi:MoaA/NifB/PqqE/SkfB family radical SAM enzyme